MTKTPARAPVAHLALTGLALLSLTLLAGLALVGTAAQRALAPWWATSTGGPAASAPDTQALLQWLKLNQGLAQALPMLTVGMAATGLLLLALGATAWRQWRRSAAAAAQAAARAGVHGADSVDSVSDDKPEAACDPAEPASPVTADLLSREQFLALHRAALAPGAQNKPRLAFLCFELERLQSINALLGFEAGDEALAQTLRRARADLGAHTVLAQCGASTLATLVHLEGPQTVLQRAQALRAALQHTLLWRGQCLELVVTVGCAASPEHGETPAELLRRAELALFEAQRMGTAVAVYQPAIEAARLMHLDQAACLHQALQRDELVPYLQPLWCTRSRRVVGAEVLLRWLHPTRGCLLPADFLPFAESTGRMPSITQQLLLKTAKLLQDELPTFHLSVNLSAADLREPGLAPQVQQLLQAHGLAPQLLVLEVNEGTLLAGGADARARLAELRQLGVQVAVDDFGTGPAPLAQLQHLPAGELKLHRSYTADVDHNPGRQQLLQTLVEMAHSLGLLVTAKNVETAGERAVLQHLGCDHLQGHLLGRPMPVADFLALVQVRATPRAGDGDAVTDAVTEPRSAAAAPAH